jgi:Zn-dependent peptidase ImmA (M78 family)
MTPSSRMLMRLGKALDRKAEYFLRTTQVRVEGALHRGRAGRSNRDRDAVYAQVAECVERYLEIEAILGLSVTFTMPEIKPQWDGTMDDVERVAEVLRDKWDLGLGPIPDLTAVLEDQGIKVCVIPGDPDFDALLVLLEDKTPVIAVRDDVPGDRLRFSLGHELGHLILGHSGEISKEHERVAHRFAGAFLVPRQTARAELAAWGPKHPLAFLVDLKEEYGLSVQAWVYRAHDVGIISERELGRLYRRMGKRRIEEFGDRCDPEMPRRMERLVDAALMNDAISVTKAAEILARPIREVSRKLEKFNAATIGVACS